MHSCELLIIGGGIVGLTLAREFLHRGVNNIIILEKEDDLGRHSSGRNSGVMHAGIYYAPGSLRAKLCLDGCRRMKNYCKERGLPLRETGKVIVAKNPSEIETLQELFSRATINGATVELIDEKQLEIYEPHAKTYQKAIYSRETAVVDPQAILQTLKKELLETKKVSILYNTEFKKPQKNRRIETNQGLIEYRFFINAAGAFADKVAHQFGVATNLSMIPFKGIYQKLKPEYSHLVNGNIYPVPNIHNPFLGVHFTKNIHGDVYLGPTAIPAFGRENYGIFQGIDSEAFSILWKEAILFFMNPKFRKVALSEPLKYSSHYFFQDCAKLVKKLEPTWLSKTSKIGIRPQLVDWNKKELIMDFLCEEDEYGIHILNAISPAFTSSLSFAEWVANAHSFENQ